MSDVRYPVFYGTADATMPRLRELFEPGMHPEFARCLFPWIESMGGEIGIGSGPRTFQPDRPGFASSLSKTFHWAGQTWEGTGARWYAAVDLVARNRRPLLARVFSLNGHPNNAGRLARAVSVTAKHRAPTWDEVATGPDYNVHAFIRSPYPEPWHVQPRMATDDREIRGWGDWVGRGRPNPDPDFRIPGDFPPPPLIPDPEDPMTFISGHALAQLEGVVVARPDGTPATGAELAAAGGLDRLVAAGEVLQISRAQVPDQWAFVGAVIAKAGPGGAAIADRFRAVGGQFPS